MTRLCEVDGCDQVHAARGMCKPHYGRWRRAQNRTVEPAKIDPAPLVAKVEWLTAVARANCERDIELGWGTVVGKNDAKHLSRAAERGWIFEDAADRIGCAIGWPLELLYPTDTWENTDDAAA